MAGRHLLVPFTLAGISIAAASAGALAQQAETDRVAEAARVLLVRADGDAEELGAALFIHPQSTPQLAARLRGNGWIQRP